MRGRRCSRSCNAELYKTGTILIHRRARVTLTFVNLIDLASFAPSTVEGEGTITVNKEKSLPVWACCSVYVSLNVLITVLGIEHWDHQYVSPGWPQNNVTFWRRKRSMNCWKFNAMLLWSTETWTETWQNTKSEERAALQLWAPSFF